MSKIRCLAPFTNIEVTKSGIFPCCSAWFAMGPLGDVRQESLIDIWNGEKFQYLRRKMYEGNLQGICDAESCPVMISGETIDLDEVDSEKYFVSPELLDDLRQERSIISVGPAKITLSDSGACNLRCIMCGSGTNYRGEDKTVSERTMQELNAVLPGLKQLRLTGDGDPFFRRDTRTFLETFDPVKYPNVQFVILTNGQMLDQKMWEKIRHNNISEVWVSVDAARQETYEKIRVGGSWTRLLRNLEMISEIRRNGEIKVFEINMTIMRSNYREILGFLQMGKDLGCDSIALQRFYGHTPERENVFEPPDKKVFLEIQRMMADPIFSGVNVWKDGLGDVERYRPSFGDGIAYESYQARRKVRRFYDRHVGWRFPGQR